MKHISGDLFKHVNNFFSTGFENDKLIEYGGSINHDCVEGTFKEWYFNGIRMAYIILNYKQPVVLKWDYDLNVELVTFQANIDGDVFYASG